MHSIRNLTLLALASVFVLACGTVKTGQAPEGSSPESVQVKAVTVAQTTGKPTMPKVCSNCHDPETNTIRGYFDNVAFKSKTIQIKMDDGVELFRFDEAALQVEEGKKTEKPEALRSVKKGHEVSIKFIEKDGAKYASLFEIKPPIEVPPEQLLTLAELEKLVAQGPEVGNYTLVDSRPLPRFQEGFIPTAINLPYPSFDKMKDRLPQDKSKLLIFYCGGVTCSMSPKSAKKSEKLGYTKLKVYHGGMPEWSKSHFAHVSVEFLKEAWIDKDIPHVLLDVRDAKAHSAGYIKGAVGMPQAQIGKALKSFPDLKLKPPVILYDENGGEEAEKAAKAILKAGYQNVKVLKGGLQAWKGANLALETGKISTKVAYVPKLRAGEMTVEEFKKLLAKLPADTVILDVRNSDEANAGMIKTAQLLPAEEIDFRLNEVPRDKRIVTHCATGVRAEMAYHTLKQKGFANVWFVNSKMEIDRSGKVQFGD